MSNSYYLKLSQPNQLKYNDTVFSVVVKRDNDSLTRNYLYKLAGRYFNLEQYEKSFGASRICNKLAIASRDSLYIARSSYYMGEYYFDKFQNDSAYSYLTKAEKIYNRLKNHENSNRLQFFKTLIFLYARDYSGSETATINILKTAKKQNDTRLTYDCYMTLGNALVGLKNPKKAIEYYNKAFSIVESLKSDSQYLTLKALPFNYIGYIYSEKKEYSMAIRYFKKALSFGNIKKTDPAMYANIISDLGYAEFKLGNKSSILYLTEALDIRNHITLYRTPGVVSSKVYLSEYYLAQKDTTKAFLYGNTARVLAHKYKLFDDELRTLQLLAKIEPKNTVRYNDRFIELTDSLQNNERATRDKFARIEFETDEILSEKNHIEAEKNKISGQRWLILGSCFSILMVGGLLYVTKMQHSKNKELQLIQEQQKSNEEIYQLMLSQQSKIDEGRENEKKRIAQELHDGIMSKLTSTRLNLFILSKKTDEETIRKCLLHIAEIQNIEKEIRAISHDLSENIFLGKDSFKMIIEGLFEDQKNISKTNFDFHVDENINWDLIGSTVKMNIYRVFQETLQNIRKYANAKKVNATVMLEENKIYINIIDDGVGFDTTKTNIGIGLKNMKSRLASIDGEIDIISKKDKGTQIKLIIPM